MSVVLIDAAARARLQEVKKFAEANRLSIQDIKDTIAGKQKPVGDDERRVVHFPGTGLRLVLSLEEQPLGWMWHLSMSIPKKNYVPDRPLAVLIMQELGINPENTVHVWPEKCLVDHVSLNILVKAAEMDPHRN